MHNVIRTHLLVLIWIGVIEKNNKNEIFNSLPFSCNFLVIEITDAFTSATRCPSYVA